MKLNKLKYFAFFVLVLIIVNCNLILAEEYSISVDTDKNNYYKGDNVIISGFLKFENIGVAGSVPIEIRYRDNSIVYLGIVSANENGSYSAIYQIKDDDRLGNYTVYVANEGTARANTTYKITNDYISPGSISNLSHSSISSDSITWNWINPTDSDFYQNIVYINGINVINTSSNSYTANGLSPSTSYLIIIHTIDYQDNINDSDILDTATTLAASQGTWGGGGGGSSGGIPQIKKINASFEKKVNTSIGKINKTQEKNKEILFDISIKVLKKEISQKENLTCSISLLNIGIPGRVNASVYYLIKDSKGNVYYENRETVFIETQKGFIKNFDVSELNEGNYTIVADLAYLGQTEPASSEDSFKIVKERDNRFILLIALLVSAVIVGLGIFFFILFKRRMQKEGKWEMIKDKWKKYWKDILEKIKMIWKKIKESLNFKKNHNNISSIDSIPKP